MGLNPQKRRNWKKRLIEENGCYCAICKKEFEEEVLNLDHIIPKKEHGKDTYNNMQLTCYNCNFLRHKEKKKE